MNFIVKRIFLIIFLSVGVLTFCSPDSVSCHQSSEAQLLSKKVDSSNNTDSSCALICICSMSCHVTFAEKPSKPILAKIFLKSSNIQTIYSFHLQEYIKSIDRPPIS